MIPIDSYTYTLPDDKIASRPLPNRDQSKLLVYENGEIVHSGFGLIEKFLPENSILFFNNTRVIPARILFAKKTGAVIEIFLLNPHTPHQIQEAMQKTGTVEWHCTIGNLKRWTPGATLKKKTGEYSLHADLLESGIVKFSWTPASLTFAEILPLMGDTPLPPYIKRKPDDQDPDRYQTVYSSADGAVAAPTAGLHFTDEVLKRIAEKGILADFLTLHVSAGTFQPVKVANALDHTMHAEQIIVSRMNIETLLTAGKKIIAVGTTSLRTIESLYWYGRRLLSDPSADLSIRQMDPYQEGDRPTKEEALWAILGAMDKRKVNSLSGETSIYILPGYDFKICEGLITNFHQPGSTLMLLVAAFVGNDWRKIYEAALANGYRFLSYGDTSLLLKGK